MHSGDELEQYARESHLTFEEFFMAHGPGIKFNPEQLVCLFLMAYRLMEIGMTTGGVELAWTIDGASISKCATHVTGGFRLIDKHAKDPITGCPIFIAADQHSSTKVQS